MEAGCVSSAAERNHIAYVAVLTNTCTLTEWVFVYVSVCVAVSLEYLKLLSLFGCVASV